MEESARLRALKSLWMIFAGIVAALVMSPFYLAAWLAGCAWDGLKSGWKSAVD